MAGSYCGTGYFKGNFSPDWRILLDKQFDPRGKFVYHNGKLWCKALKIKTEKA